MRKIVINDGFGGFGVSVGALKQLIDRGSQLVEKNTIAEFFGERGLRKEEWSEWKYGYQKHRMYTGLMKDGFVYTCGSRCPDNGRECPILIDLVEEATRKDTLGEINGQCASLKVVEIPDDVDYEIEEYDGNEWVAEKHRVWR